jgi:hypothetical protein
VQLARALIDAYTQTIARIRMLSRSDQQACRGPVFEKNLSNNRNAGTDEAAMHSNLKPAGYSDRKPATLGVNRMGRFDDVVEG